MGIIDITIRYADKEWQQIESVIQKKHEGKSVSFNGGKGYQHFIHSEITKLFHDFEIGDCVEVKSSRTQKHFELKLSDETENKLRCLANKLGIEPGMLIARMTFDPYLFPIDH